MRLPLARFVKYHTWWDGASTADATALFYQRLSEQSDDGEDSDGEPIVLVKANRRIAHTTTTRSVKRHTLSGSSSAADLERMGTASNLGDDDEDFQNPPIPQTNAPPLQVVLGVLGPPLVISEAWS